MVTLGKKRNKPTLQTRLRGLAGQARKVELAEPVLRQRRMERRMNNLGDTNGDSIYLYDTEQAATGNLERTMQYPAQSRALASQPPAYQTTPASITQPPRTSRSVQSTVSDYTKRVTRNELVKKKHGNEDGMWDKILVFNQQEGRRIASLAASENARRREENKAFLDEQVAIQERRRQKDEFAQLQYVKEQKQRLKKLEAEELRKEALHREKIKKVKIEQDEAIALVKRRKAHEREREKQEGIEMMKKIHQDEMLDRQKQMKKLAEEKERALELKEDLKKQLAAREEAKKFEAAEERMLQKIAKQKAAAEEAARQKALEELFEKMKSKQKIGESTAADVAAIAREDEARAKRHQAEHAEKERKAAESKRLKQQADQKAILESLELQLTLKTQKQEELLADKAKEAIKLKRDSEKAFQAACADRDAEQKKKQDYFAELTQQITDVKKRKDQYAGMSHIERQFNHKVIKKMQNLGL